MGRNEMNSEQAGQTARIKFASGDVEELLVTPVGPSLFRLEESSLLDELRFHDVIEAGYEPDGGLQFLRLVSQSNLNTTTWLLPKELDDAEAFHSMLDRVVSVGGNWEKVFGGVLMLHLPTSEESTILEDVNALLRPFQTSKSQP
jgi:hypothetical protein